MVSSSYVFKQNYLLLEFRLKFLRPEGLCLKSLSLGRTDLCLELFCWIVPSLLLGAC